MGLTLTFNTGIIFATENSALNSSNQDNFTSTTSSSTTASNITGSSASNTIKNSTRYEGTPDSTTTNAAETTSSIKAAGAAKTIKVLIYSGSEASTNCVNGIKRALDYANTNSVIAGVVFSYATSTIINTAALNGYDVLAMPGGSGGSDYLNSNSISSSAIKNFIASGKGYIGICAGAYSAASHTDYYYDGWGIAPHVKCKAVSYEGGLTLQITSAGEQVLGQSGTKTLAHYNGPAMYTSGGAVTFATYADSSTGYKGYAAIVGNYYGNGRVVLSGPHPELSPLVPTYVSKLIYWAASSTPTVKTLTVKQIATAAASVKSFYEKNKRLPNYVTTSAGQLSMPTFLNLMATATTQANSGITTPITVTNVNAPASASNSYKKGNILKSEFLSIAKSIKNYITTYGKPQSYITTSLGKINYSTAVYMFSKIMGFYNTNQRLPNYVSI